MNKTKIRIAVCLAAILSILTFQTGYSKSNSSSTKQTNIKLSNATKKISLEQLLPKTDAVTGKYKNQISEDILNDYTYGTLAGQYGKIDTATKYLQKVLKKEPNYHRFFFYFPSTFWQLQYVNYFFKIIKGTSISSVKEV